jgi:electron transport complex protein RnfG
MMNTDTRPRLTLDAIRERLSYQPLLLGSVTLLAGAALTLANTATREAIAIAETRDMQMTLAQVLPRDFADNDLLQDTLDLPGPTSGSTRRIHLAKKAGAITGAIFNVAERGYAGEIRLLMAVDADGRILGVRVLKHSETPGLGDKIEIARHAWITSFDGKSLDDPTPARWAVRKDGGIYDSFAGATVTPRAVVKAVKGGLDYFAAHRRQILGDPQ